MKKNKYSQNQTGKVNYIWVLAGGYLLYLAFKLFRGAFLKEVDNLYMAIGAGVLFVAVGAYALYREWRAYKFGLDNIDDPTTWSDEEEDAQLEALMSAAKAAAETDSADHSVREELEDGENEEEQA